MIELIEYAIGSDPSGNRLEDFGLSLNQGAVCAIRSDSPDNSRMFLKALATLLKPVRGIYRFRGEPLDFSDYRKLLPYKKRIGYIGSDAALITNLSIEENLTLMRQYDENSLEISPEGATLDLIRLFGLQHTMAMRPGSLAPQVQRLAIAVRELAKSPDLLLIEYPEDYIGKANLGAFKQAIAGMPLARMAIVMISEDEELIGQYANTFLSINSGTLAKMPIG